jgi:SEC-C motif
MPAKGLASFDPGRYSEIPVLELLHAAALGWIGVDQRLVKSILDRGEPGMADALTFAHESGQDHRVDLDPLLIDLFRHSPHPQAVDFFMDAIRRQPEDIDDHLIQALIPLGEQAMDGLLALYEELGEEQGSDIAFLLAGLRVRDPRVLAVLLERLEFDAADGAFCLGLYGDAAARPALEKMLAEVEAETVEPELPEEAELKREIAHAIEQLDAPEPRYQPEPFDILAEYPERELPDADVLSESERLELLESPDAEVRAEAAHSFFNRELLPKARASLLAMAKTDADAAARGRAWASLADAAEDASIRAAMLAILRDTAKPVEERGGAAVGLYGFAEDTDARAAIEALYEEGGTARAKAMEAMWRSLYKPFAKYFAGHLDDPDKSILHQALRGAGYFRLTTQADKIAKYFEDDDFRDDALFAYALAVPGETTRGRARGILRKIDSITHLMPGETRLVMFAIDERLRLHGLAPVFETEDESEEPKVPEPPPEMTAPPPSKPGRNDPCPCGSGKKYKKCHGK